MRKSSLLCQSLDEKLEESLTDQFLDLMAHVESLAVLPREERDGLLRELARLQGDVDAMASQMSLLDMSLLDARTQLRAKDEELRRVHITNPGVFSELYEQGEQLGKGKFGVVYECTPRHDPSKRYAVKVLSCKGEAIKDLNNEVRLLSCVRAPNIVQLVETFVDAEKFYLVMEKVEGGELFEVLATVSHYSEQESRDAFRQIMEALIILRHHHVVHRDLKPENVLLTARNPSSQIKLADFGLAVQVEPGEMLKEGVGTPNYIAPEVLQCLEDEDDAEGYDFSCDTWSAGCILHILLCGKTPFGHIEDMDEMYDAILAGRVPLDAPEWESVSEEAKGLVRGLLTVDPSERLSGKKVMKSPWMADARLELKKLPGTHLELKNFSAKRRWKSSILAIMATNRVKTLADMRGAAERKRFKHEQEQ